MRALASAILVLAAVAACDPIQGSGTGEPPDPAHYIQVDAANRSAVVTLITGYPATDIQFNFNGYGSGALVLTVPVGWQVTVQCQNHGTVNNSCSIVSDAHATEPIQPSWTTPDPQRGLDPGGSATFVFTPDRAGSFRIASLVDGHEASGAWLDLEVTTSGTASLKAPGF